MWRGVTAVSKLRDDLTFKAMTHTPTRPDVPVGSELVCICVMGLQLDCRCYPRWIRQDGNHDKLKMDNWIVGT